MSNPKANRMLASENVRLKLAYATILEKLNNAEMALNRAITFLDEYSDESATIEVRSLWQDGEDSIFHENDSDESV